MAEAKKGFCDECFVPRKLEEFIKSDTFTKHLKHLPVREAAAKLLETLALQGVCAEGKPKISDEWVREEDNVNIIALDCGNKLLSDKGAHICDGLSEGGAGGHFYPQFEYLPEAELSPELQARLDELRRSEPS